MSSLDAMIRWRHLSRAALLSLVIHLVAGLAMAFVLRHGLDTELDRGERLSFLADHTAVWVLGWFLWNLAALSILYFYHCLASVLDGEDPTNPLPGFAVYVSGAAIALDLAAEAIEMGLLPQLARQAVAATMHLESPGPFDVWHRTAVMLTGFAANGLYTLSAVVLAWCGRSLFPRWVSFAAAVVGVGGFGLSLAALLDWVTGMVAANVVLLPALLLWQLGIWRSARQTGKVALG